MNFKKLLKSIGNRIKEFFSDEYGGNIVEYALLVGFGLFIFFVIIGVITSILDWTVGLSDDFWNLFGG
jgi:Flp pilus assembly pilin Flp